MNECVKEIRKSLGLSLEKFGKKIGIKKSTMSNIENGNAALTDRNINAICREYNVNETWLRTGNGRKFIDIDEEEELTNWVSNTLANASSDFQKSFVKMLMNLTDEQWLTLEDKIHELYEEQIATAPEADYRLYHTDSYVAETSPDEEYNTIEAAGAAYNKSRLNSVQKTTLSASNITATTGTDGNGK